MYLALLNDEQKELYINLAINLASVDGNFSQEEKAVIEAYCYEMGITYDFSKEIKEVEDVIEKLNEISGIREKRIIVFETIGLAMADRDFQNSERAVIVTLIKKFGLEEIYIEECENILEKYIEFQREINDLVIG